MKSWKAELLLVVVTMIWGATFLFTQIGLEYSSPSMYVLLRFGIALLILLIFFGRHLKGIDKKTVKQGIILGLIYGIGFLLQTFGLKYTTIPKSSFITGLVVCTVPFVYWFIERRPIKLWQKIGVIVASIGLLIFTKPDFNNINIGDAITLLSTVVWGYFLTYMDIFTRGHDSLKRTTQMVVLQYIAAAPLAGLTLFIFDSGNISIQWSNALLISLGFNAIMASVIATFIHTGVQKYSTPVKAALIFSLEPIFATTIAIIFQHIVLKNYEIIGGIILISGVLISEIFPFIFNKKKISRSNELNS